MDNKTCTVSNIEKHINYFYKKFSQCKECNIKRCLKRYFDIKDEISIQQNLCYEKNREKLLQKQNDYRNKRNLDFKELHRSYDELQYKLKAIKEKVKLNDSEKQLNIYKRNLFKTFRKELCYKQNRCLSYR